MVKKRKKREKEENIKFKKIKNFKIKEKCTDGGGRGKEIKGKRKESKGSVHVKKHHLRFFSNFKH